MTTPQGLLPSVPPVIGALTAKPRWDKYDPYVGNFRAPLAEDATLAMANRVLGVGINSDGACVIGAGQTGVIGVIIMPVGIDIHGYLLEPPIAGDVVDIGKHGEITNFVPTEVDEVQTLTITGTPTTGGIVLAVTTTIDNGDGTTTSDTQYTTPLAVNAQAADVEAALAGLGNVNQGLGESNVAVTGGPGPGTPFAISFGGIFAGTNQVSQIQAITDGTHGSTALGGGTNPAVTTSVTTQPSVPVAGTKYYAHSDGTVNTTSSGGVYIGHTAEASRLIVNIAA